jgi:hypothetical protein
VIGIYAWRRSLGAAWLNFLLLFVILRARAFHGSARLDLAVARADRAA